MLLGAVGALGAPPGLQKDWQSVHGDLAGERYAAVGEIDRKNVAQLGAIWVSARFANGAMSRMTPLVHNGFMFFAAGPRIYALDARTGRIAWAHQTETRNSAESFSDPAAAQLAGLAISRSWGLGLGGGMVFAGLVNGHMIALRETSGEVVWNKMISDEPLPIAKGITCPPLYVDGVLYLGTGIEYSRGKVVAVDAATGTVLWRVPMVPGPGEAGHESWPKDSGIWHSGGANPWAAGAADRDLGLLYFVTGNPGPSSGGRVRPGDNLYAVSVLALSLKDGKIRWHSQLIHHDIWESDLSVSPVLFDAHVGNGTRKAIAIMRADGYLFEFDRATGEPIVLIDERPVPQNVELFTAPTQPFPHGGESILPPCESSKSKVPNGFLLACMFDPPAHGVPNRLTRYGSVRIAPMSYSPATGYFYAQGADVLMKLGTGDDPYVSDLTPGGDRIPDFPKPVVIVAAIDSRTDRVVWRKELPSADELGFRADGGSLSTVGGLVFHQGGDGTLQAYDARTGDTLWRFQTDFAGGDASPMSYSIDGREYVAFIAGSRVWAFALGGKVPQAAPIPRPPHESVIGPIEDTNEVETLTLEEVAANGHRYHLNEYAFNPYRARIQAGDSITFVNNGYLPHTIVAQDRSWTTRTLGPTEIETVRFDKPGSYTYSSAEYPWSYGQIIVAPRISPSESSTSSEAARTAADQVSRGKAAYATSCTQCHGQNLAGRDPAPALAGAGFLARWAQRPVAELFDRTRISMPPTAPGSLNEQTYAAIVAYILHANAEDAPTVLDRNTMQKISISTR